MKKYFYDFIIGYEHVNRELNSICLLKNYLNKKGYSVFIYNIYDDRIINSFERYYCDVLMLPAGYNDYVLKAWTGRGIIFNKLVNLQWEQALTKEMESTRSYKTPSGLFARYAYHIAWGDSNKDRLYRFADIDSKRIFVCGHMAMNFLSKPFCYMYLSRKQIMEKYGWDSSRKIRLFIGSFKAAFNNSKLLEDECKMYGESRRVQHEIMLQTFNKTMEWFSTAAKENPNDIFIYRPHPGEMARWTDDVKRQMEQKCKEYNNFFVIEDMSVQQWILVADWMCTGLSTTVVEAFFAQKSCCVLYPYDIPEKLQMRLFENAQFVRNEAEFREALNKKTSFPIPREDIDYYYKDANAVHNVADYMEFVHKKGIAIPPFEIERIYSIKGRNLVCTYKNVKKVIESLYLFKRIESIIWRGMIWNAKKREKYYNYSKKKHDVMKEFVSEEQIEKICRKIKSLSNKDMEM